MISHKCGTLEALLTATTDTNNNQEGLVDWQHMNCMASPETQVQHHQLPAHININKQSRQNNVASGDSIAWMGEHT